MNLQPGSQTGEGPHSEDLPGVIPEALIVHRTNNRLRLRVPSRKGNSEYFSVLSGAFSNVEGVEVNANTLTGSLLIVHNRSANAMIDTTIAALTHRGLLRIKGDLKEKGRLNQQIESIFNNVDSRITKATGGEINLPMLAFIILGGAGIFQIARGNFNALPWYTAFWYALSLFRKAKPGG